jgi:hypothetical protein
MGFVLAETGIKGERWSRASAAQQRLRRLPTVALRLRTNNNPEFERS